MVLLTIPKDGTLRLEIGPGGLSARGIRAMLALVPLSFITILCLVGAARRLVGADENAVIDALIVGVVGLSALAGVSGCLLRAFGSQSLEVTSGVAVIRWNCVLWRLTRTRWMADGPARLIACPPTWASMVFEHAVYTWPGVSGAFALGDADGGVVANFGVGLDPGEARTAIERVRSLGTSPESPILRLL